MIRRASSESADSVYNHRPYFAMGPEAGLEHPLKLGPRRMPLGTPGLLVEFDDGVTLLQAVRPALFFLRLDTEAVQLVFRADPAIDDRPGLLNNRRLAPYESIFPDCRDLLFTDHRSPPPCRGATHLNRWVDQRQIGIEA